MNPKAIPSELSTVWRSLTCNRQSWVWAW